MKTALIIGITGQDGSYLTEHLLEKGYTVHGLVRRASMFNRARIDHLRSANRDHQDRLQLHYGELNDLSSLRRLLNKIHPEEVYHLGGQSHVGLSFEIPEVTCNENAMCTLGLLELLRDLNRPVRLFFAASSEIFGNPRESPQDENTPLNPVNPYGCAKAFSIQICRVYRNTYGLHICSAIAYNHESPRRSENFVTKKIAGAVAKIKRGQMDCLSLGNLDSRRDWGYAAEYVRAMHAMVVHERPDDYVLATGEACSVRDFVWAAFKAANIELEFSGTGEAEHARRTDTGNVVVKVDPRFYRPVEPHALVGNARRAREKLGWEPKIKGVALAELMVAAELDAA